MKVTFSINLYDKDGDKFEDGIYLHIEPNMILEFNDVEELKNFAEDILNKVVPEIQENLQQ